MAERNCLSSWPDLRIGFGFISPHHLLISSRHRTSTNLKSIHYFIYSSWLLLGLSIHLSTSVKDNLQIENRLPCMGLNPSPSFPRRLPNIVLYSHQFDQQKAEKKAETLQPYKIASSFYYDLPNFDFICKTYP